MNRRTGTALGFGLAKSYQKDDGDSAVAPNPGSLETGSQAARFRLLGVPPWGVTFPGVDRT